MRNNTVSVQILDKQYQVACPDNQRQELIESARLLDEQMRSIRDSGKVVGLERIAVMAALNLAHELIDTRRAGAQQELDLNASAAAKDALGRLDEKLDDALARLRTAPSR